MNFISSVVTKPQTAPGPSHAANQIAANAARTAQSAAAGRLSWDRGRADPGVVAIDRQMLTTAIATANTADAWMRSGSGLNITAFK